MRSVPVSDPATATETATATDPVSATASAADTVSAADTDTDSATVTDPATDSDSESGHGLAHRHRVQADRQPPRNHCSFRLGSGKVTHAAYPFGALARRLGEEAMR